MSQSIKEIKKRIQSTKKTGQITKAMYMVSQSKVKRSEKARVNYASFLQNIKNLTKTAFLKAPDYQNVMLEEKPQKKVLYLLVSSDTGLAGGYNNQLFRYFKAKKENTDCEYLVATIGRKAYYHALSNKEPLLNKNATLIRDDVMFLDIAPITKEFVRLYIEGAIDHVYVIYNHYVNSLQIEVKEEVLLPLSTVEGEIYENEFIFENGTEKCLNDLIPMYIESLLYGIILDAKSAEHSSRMNAMKNASDNVDEIVSKYNLIYNRARQQAITTELTDIIAGSNAVSKESMAKTYSSARSELEKTYLEEANLRFVTVYSKEPLDADEIAKISTSLAGFYQGQKIHLIKKIDSEIKAGYYMFVDNKRLDFNLDNVIFKLKELMR